MAARSMQHPTSGKNPYFDVVLDPWSAKPAQLPDEYVGHTIPHKIRQSYTIAATQAGGAGGAGAAAFIFTPQLSNIGRVPTLFTATANTISTWGNAAALDDYTSLNAACKLMRFVSVGVCVSYIGSESAAAGEIIIAPLEGHADADISTLITDWADYSGAIRKQIAGIREPVCAALSAFDRPNFGPLNTNFYALFPALAIGITGAGTSSFRVDLTLNVELVGYPSSVMHHMGSNSPANTDDMDDVRRRLPASRVDANGMLALTTPPRGMFRPLSSRPVTSRKRTRYTPDAAGGATPPRRPQGKRPKVFLGATRYARTPSSFRVANFTGAMRPSYGGSGFRQYPRAHY